MEVMLLAIIMMTIILGFVCFSFVCSVGSCLFWPAQPRPGWWLDIRNIYLHCLYPLSPGTLREKFKHRTFIVLSHPNRVHHWQSLSSHEPWWYHVCVWKKEIVTVLSSVISSLLSVYLVAVVEVVVEPVGEVVVVGEECVVVSVGS